MKSLLSLVPMTAAAGMLLSTPLSAQGAVDSLAERLRRAELMIEMLRSQSGQTAEAKVEPRSRNRVELSGVVLVNGFFNNAKVNNSDVPQFVLPPDPPPPGQLPVSNLGGTVRQSRIALTAFVPSLAGGSFTGEVDFDFFGGQQPSSGGRTFPLIRMRRVRGEVAWRHAWFMFGQEGPPIAEVNPSSLAAMGFPGFAAAGNLWLWIPQIRFGLEAGSGLKFGLEGSVLAPSTEEPQPDFATQPTRAERSKRPNLQGRLRVRWGEGSGAGEISMGGHYGWFATPGDTLLTTRGTAASGRFTLSRFVELRGEAFTGQALAGLGGGGIGQNFGIGGVPVRSTGGWAQLNILPASSWEIGGGYGEDNPDDTDLLPAGATVPRLKNVSYEGHLHWRPAPLVFGVEYRRIETLYEAAIGKQALNHISVAMGWEF